MRKGKYSANNTNNGRDKQTKYSCTTRETVRILTTVQQYNRTMKEDGKRGYNAIILTKLGKIKWYIRNSSYIRTSVLTYLRTSIPPYISTLKKQDRRKEYDDIILTNTKYSKDKKIRTSYVSVQPYVHTTVQPYTRTSLSPYYRTSVPPYHPYSRTLRERDKKRSDIMLDY